jgi:hypothetical protein
VVIQVLDKACSSVGGLDFKSKLMLKSAEKALEKTTGVAMRGVLDCAALPPTEGFDLDQCLSIGLKYNTGFTAIALAVLLMYVTSLLVAYSASVQLFGPAHFEWPTFSCCCYQSADANESKQNDTPVLVPMPVLAATADMNV